MAAPSAGAAGSDDVPAQPIPAATSIATMVVRMSSSLCPEHERSEPAGDCPRLLDANDRDALRMMLHRALAGEGTRHHFSG